MHRLQTAISHTMTAVTICVLLAFLLLLERMPTDVLDLAVQSPLGWGLCLLSGAVYARLAGGAAKGPTVRSLLFASMVWAYLVALYLMWAHYRVKRGSWSDLVHGFPYPDLAINALAHWYDVRNPAPPGMLKMHGEYPRVAATIGILIMLFMGLAGVLYGLQIGAGKRKRPGLPGTLRGAASR
jgi:hypothetical protein